MRLVHGDCVEVLKRLKPGVIDAIVTDPPYGLEFMGKAWDKLDWQAGGGFAAPGIGARPTAWPSFSTSTPFGATNPTCATCGGRLRGANKCACEEPAWKVKGAAPSATINADAMRAQQEWHQRWLTEAFRVLKPGGHLLAFGGTRTYHRLACAAEDAGFEIRDMFEWNYGCLSEDTEILVNGDWVHYRSAIAGSLVLCYDVEHDTFSQQPVEQLFVYDYDDVAYRIESDRTDQVVSRNHRCIVQRDEGWQFRYAEELAREQEARVPVLEAVSHAVRVESSAQAVRASGFTTSDLARITPFHLIGKVWCVKVPTGAFVARRNGKVFITGNSGFPKSLDVSKAIDKAAGATREVVGYDASRARPNRTYNSGAIGNIGGSDTPSDRTDNGATKTAPATDAARQWYGWGTALKPAHEPILVARKPLIGTVAANVQAHGTGGINIEGCRVGFASEDDKASAFPGGRTTSQGAGALAGPESARDVERSGFQAERAAGRWPPNVLFTHSPECVRVGERIELRRGTPSGMDRFNAANAAAGYRPNAYAQGAPGAPPTEKLPHHIYECAPGCPVAVLDGQTADSGGASRFFPVLNFDPLDDAGFLYVAKAAGKERHAGLGEGKNTHPTVKPVALMRWLVRLVTPPGGVVLDPFLGSGTTGVAAKLEGFLFVGVEQEAEYLGIAQRRIDAAG